jgi:hypothetical protein
MFSTTQIILLAVIFSAIGNGIFLYIYCFRLNKTSHKKILLYLAALLNVLIIASFIITAIYTGKFVRFYGGYSVLLLISIAVLIIPSLYYLWRKRTVQEMISGFKIKW